MQGANAWGKDMGQRHGAKTWGKDMGQRHGAKTWGKDMGQRPGAEAKARHLLSSLSLVIAHYIPVPNQVL
jgi:hypothetical protein